jgi:hypothetical protein
MTTSGLQEGAPTGRPPYEEKVWTAHLRTALRTPAQGWPFVQLPPGEYKLYARADVGYELRISEQYSCYFRLAEVEAMRSTGEIVIDESWPQ